MKILLLLISLCSLLFSQQNKNDTLPQKLDYKIYLKHRFNYEINQYTRITYRTKDKMLQDWYDEEGSKSKLYARDTIYLLNAINKRWQSGMTEFIDSLYTVDPQDTNFRNGLYIKFLGDSTFYTFGKYRNGIRDSIWIHKTKGGNVSVFNYKNGIEDGIQEVKYYDGGRSVYKMRNGIPIDTGYLYYPSGKIQSIDIYKNGKLFSSKCFRENGKPVDCTTMAME